MDQPRPIERDFVKSKELFASLIITGAAIMTRTKTIWLTACTLLDTVLEHPFSLDLNADSSREAVLEICRQCKEAGDTAACKSQPVKVRLTIKAERV